MEWSVVAAPASSYDIGAVITTFRPDEVFPERVWRVQSQVGCVVIGRYNADQ